MHGGVLAPRLMYEVNVGFGRSRINSVKMRALRTRAGSSLMGGKIRMGDQDQLNMTKLKKNVLKNG